MSAIINASATTPEYLHALDQTTGIFSGGVSTPLTLAAWVKEVTDTTGTQCPISLNRGNTNNYFFSLRMEKGANSSACYASARVNAAGGGIAAGAELSSILDTCCV